MFAEPTDNQSENPERFQDTVRKDEGPVFLTGRQHAVQGLPVRTVQRMEEGMWKAKGRYGFIAVMHGIYRTMGMEVQTSSPLSYSGLLWQPHGFSISVLQHPFDVTFPVQHLASEPDIGQPAFVTVFLEGSAADFQHYGEFTVGQKMLSVQYWAAIPG